MQRNGLGAVDRLAQDRVAGSPEGANALVVSGAVPAVTVSAAAAVLNSKNIIYMVRALYKTPFNGARIIKNTI